METLQTVLSSPWVLATWVLLAVASLVVVVTDLRTRNSHIMPLMKLVWGLTVAYSGPLGLAIYWLTGRKEIANDHLWRRGFRSVAHCYSGCGMGEIIGLAIAVGLFAAGNLVTALVTFSLAFLFGVGLTMGPLIEDGVDPRTALKDAILSETPSIATMEAVAIGSDIWIAGGAGIGQLLFWGSLVISLTLGLIAAYPVNLLLLRYGVKEGMMDPRKTDM